jgi:hypothetical protein
LFIPVQVGDPITFKLLKRSKGCILPEALAAPSAVVPLPRNSEGCSGAAPAPGLLGNIFAKFAVVTGDQAATALWRESAADLAAYAVQVGGHLIAAQVFLHLIASSIWCPSSQQSQGSTIGCPDGA